MTARGKTISGVHCNILVHSKWFFGTCADASRAEWQMKNATNKLSGITSKDVLTRADCQRRLMDILTERKLRYVGDVMRAHGLDRDLLKGMVMAPEVEEDQKLGIRMMSNRFVADSFKVLVGSQITEVNGVISPS